LETSLQDFIAGRAQPAVPRVANSFFARSLFAASRHAYASGDSAYYKTEAGI